MEAKVRLGYHTVSDDCVTSAYLSPYQASDRIIDLLAAEYKNDVDHIWLRNADDEVVWEWKRDSD